jgi:hypothetical protein
VFHSTYDPFANQVISRYIDHARLSTHANNRGVGLLLAPFFHIDGIMRKNTAEARTDGENAELLVRITRWSLHFAILIALGGFTRCFAQDLEDRWSLGLRGGVNLLRNDFNIRKVGSNIETTGRYGLSQSWSLGASLGYEELKSHQVPDTLPLPFDYVRLDAFPISLTAWYHPLQGEKISPFIYAGIGAMLYQRWNGVRYFPDSGVNTTVHVPIGIGMETVLSKDLTFTADLSYRFLNDLTETFSRGGPDSYVGLKAGVNFYVGRRDDADDDNDGLTNREESQLETDPELADTDGEGLSDGEERRRGTDPTKPDTRRMATSLPKAAPTLIPTLPALKDSIREYEEDLSILQHLLEAATADPRKLKYTNLRRWVIANPILRDSLFSALMAVDSSLQSEAGADAEVLATSEFDLIEVRFGNAVFKGMTLKNALRKSPDPRLYQKVAESYSYSRDIELRDPQFKLRAPPEVELMTYERMLRDFDPLSSAGAPTPGYTRLDVSLYGLIFKVGPTWGGEIRIGSDELGYPFWSAGKLSLLASYERIKFGFELPLTAGRSSTDVFPPFIIRARQLNGTRGFVAEADFGPVGGKVSFTRLSENDLDRLTDPALFYYITGAVQAYYSFGVALDATNIVRAKLGAGAHRINLGSVLPDGGVLKQLSADEFSPYVKFEYLNKDVSDRFGVSMQFYELTFLFTGSLEIVPNIVSIEAKYSWPVAPDRPPWQAPEFFIVSPHVRFSF